MARGLLQSFGLSRKRNSSSGPNTRDDSSSSGDRVTQTGDKSSSNTSEGEKLGLFQFAVPSNTEDIEIDIVAVHGLFDNPYGAWKDANGKLWLRDTAFLPKLIPSARILSYGYNSSVALSQTFAGVDQFAELLLNYLEQEREAGNAKGRPIMFICHSLGGIVVKKALIVAHARSTKYYKDIVNNVKGVVFMGVPHQGAGIARLGSLFATLLQTSTAGRTTNAKLVGLLKKNSKPLSDISGEAVHRLSALEIHTFYETERYHGVVIVDKESARLGIPNEKLFPVNANHSTICRFGSEVDQTYKLVGRAMAAMAARIIGLAGVANMPKFADAGLGLHWAVKEGKVGIVKVLLHKDTSADPTNSKINVDFPNNDGNTPLIVALLAKQASIAVFLIKQGADVEYQNSEYHESRPLHIIAERGNGEGIDLLYRHNAQIEARSSLGLTPLMHAAWKGNEGTLKAVLEADAIAEAALAKEHRNAAVPGIDVGVHISERSTALHLAAQSGHIAVVQLLVEYGANLEAKTALDETPLVVASYHGYIEAVQYLLEKGAATETMTRGTFTALLHAAGQGHTEVVRTLLAHGAQIDAKKSHGMTALMEAMYCGRLFAASLLAEQGAFTH